MLGWLGWVARGDEAVNFGLMPYPFLVVFTLILFFLIDPRKNQLSLTSLADGLLYNKVSIVLLLLRFELVFNFLEQELAVTELAASYYSVHDWSVRVT